MSGLVDPKLEALLDQPVTLAGVARNARLGAVLLTPERTPVYVAGLDEWPDELDGASLSATGVLRSRKLAPDPAIDAQGGVSHGVVGNNYVLEDADWRRA